MGIFDTLHRKTPDAGESAPTSRLNARIAGLPRWTLLIVGLVLFAFVYWGVIGAILSDTEADLTLRPSAEMLPPGGSVAVGTAALLLTDAVQEKGWTPNDGVLRPTALLEDMPAFQRGQYGVLLAFVDALDAGVEGDPELAEAAVALKTPPDRGFLHGNFPFIGGSAESAYEDAAAALVRYNRALGDGGLPFGGARQMRLILIAIDRSLSQRVIAVDAMVDDAGVGSPDTQYHEVRGSAYATAMLMRGMREDFAALIAERQLAASWAEATEALDAIALADPFGVGRDDLVEQGYYLLRARDSLRALSAGAVR